MAAFPDPKDLLQALSSVDDVVVPASTPRAFDPADVRAGVRLGLVIDHLAVPLLQFG